MGVVLHHPDSPCRTEIHSPSCWEHGTPTALWWVTLQESPSTEKSCLVPTSKDFCHLITDQWKGFKKKKKSSVILSQGETVGTSQLFCIPYRINWSLYCKCIAVQSLLPNPVSFTPRTWCSPKHSQKTLGMQIRVYFLEILPSDTRDAIAPNHHDREETGKGTES